MKLNAKEQQSQLKTFGPLLYMENLITPQTLKLLIYTSLSSHPSLFALNDNRCYKTPFPLYKKKSLISQKISIIKINS